ncbi:MAG: serine/threonine protein kinase, partial [Myxococcales bacterium]|nr:serine/threonine protein kinase [Myxococcales bacterium]
AGRGLAAAHAQGIVHRDFKPDNVMVGEDGRVRVLDFGLARAQAERIPAGAAVDGRESGLALQMTRTGDAVGTPAYMSPEQFAGRTADACSDQFSFCVALFEALYGARPYVGATFYELANAVRSGSIAPPPKGSTAPAWVKTAILRGLQVEPADRWPSMGELLAALGRDPARRWRWIGAASLVAALGGFGWAAMANSEIAAVLGERVVAEEARADSEAERARREAARANEVARQSKLAARQARDRLRLVVARELDTDAAVAVNLLREVEAPAETTGWIEAANAALRQPISSAVFAHSGSVRSIDTSPDGRWFVASTEYATGEDWLTLWPTDGRGAGLALRGGAANQAIFSPSGDEIAAAGVDGVLRIYRVDGDGSPAIELRGHSSGSMGITSIVYTPDGARLISVGHDKTIRVWDRASGEQIDESGPWRGVWRVATDGRRFALGLRDMSILVRDLESGETRILRGHEHWADFLDFSPDGKQLLSGSRDNTARIWSLDEMRPPRVLRGHGDRLMAAQFSADGTRVLTASVDGTARLWPVHGGEPVILRGESKPVTVATFSRDGARVAFGDTQGTVFVTAADGDSEVVRLKGHSGLIYDLNFLPDGRLVSSSFDKDARVWEVPESADGTPTSKMYELPEHRFFPTELAYDPSGERLATAANATGEIRVWRRGTREPLYEIEHLERVGQLRWSSTGDRLLSVGESG